MKKVCIILAIVLCFSLALSSCGSNSAKDTPPSQASGEKEPAKETTEQSSGNNNSNDSVTGTAGSDEDYDTAPNPLTISEVNIKNNRPGGRLLWYYNGNDITVYECLTPEAEVVIPSTIKLNGTEEKVTAITYLFKTA